MASTNEAAVGQVRVIDFSAIISLFQRALVSSVTNYKQEKPINCGTKAADVLDNF